LIFRGTVPAVVAGALVGCLIQIRIAGAADPRAATPSQATANDHRSPEQLRQEVLERMRALRAWKIVDALKLDEATSAKLFPILARYDDREMAVATERHEVVRDLRAAAEAPQPDDTRIMATLTRLTAVRNKQRAIEDDRIKDVRKVLTLQQQAKLVLLLPRLEHDFAHWVREVAGKPGADDPGP
jgi:Spy/CpxP family protein refolding chaperone